MAEKSPTIGELNSLEAHTLMVATGDMTRYMNYPCRGWFRQEIIDRDKGTIERHALVFWYTHVDKQKNSGVLHCQIDGRYAKDADGKVTLKDDKPLITGAMLVNGEDAIKLWQGSALPDGRVARLGAISKAEWISIMAGASWPGVNEAVEIDRVAESEGKQDYLSYKARVDRMMREAQTYLDAGPAQTISDADCVGNLIDQLSNLEKLGVKLGKDDPEITPEMREVLERVRALTTRWPALTAPLKGAVQRLKLEVLTPFQKRAKALAEQRVAEAAERGVTLPKDVVRQATHVSGGKRTISLQKSSYVTKITDFNLLLEYLRNNKDLQDAMLTIANKLVRAGQTPPGCEIQTEERAV